MHFSRRRRPDEAALREAQKAFPVYPSEASWFRRLTIRRGRSFFLGLALMTIFGLGMFPWTFWTKHRVLHMQAWLPIEATVTKAEVGSSYRKAGGRRYHQDVEYRFAIGGKAYTGDREVYVGPRKTWMAASDARRFLPKIGDPISVRYDPEDPSESIIRVVAVEDSGIGLIRGISAALGIFGLGVVYFGRRR